jgi:hypothetical protein
LDFGYQLQPSRHYEHLDFTLEGSTEIGARFDIKAIVLKVYGGGGLDVVFLCIRNTPEDDLIKSV